MLIQSDEAAAQVKRTENEAKRLHLTGTPSIFVDDKKFTGGRNMEEELAKAVEKR
uniref:DSBA-like thioredoxin domain-containing protein n=1 Tax=Candidatus Kentrum sp. TC TaxID=2126339 RepID=A0A451AEB0_9GAMM|nr:MAG: DSBA-like thioredoxin domain-containing protein [Candidatus Kentron sp. TC]